MNLLTVPILSLSFGLCGGTYYVEITDSKGCVYVDSAVVTVSGNGVNCDGIGDGIEDELAAGISSMTMFPNPTSGTFNLNIELQRPDQISVEVNRSEWKNRCCKTR